MKQNVFTMKWSSLTTINGRIVCLCRVEINFGRIDSWCQCYKCIYSRLIVLNVERFTTNKKSDYKTFEKIFLFNILCLKLIAAWLILRDGGEVWNQSVILSWIQKHIIHLTSTATSSLLDGPLDSHFKEKMTFCNSWTMQVRSSTWTGFLLKFICVVSSVNSLIVLLFTA